MEVLAVTIAMLVLGGSVVWYILKCIATLDVQHKADAQMLHHRLTNVEGVALEIAAIKKDHSTLKTMMAMSGGKR